MTCPLVIWMQGEYNYWADTTRGLLPHIPNVVGKDEYKTLMLRLKNDMQNDVVSIYNQHSKPLFITYQVGAQYAEAFAQKGYAVYCFDFCGGSPGPP